MGRRDELKEDFDALLKPTGGGGNFGADSTKPIALLGKAIMRLDRTSAHLAWVNIGLGVAILLAALVQICLMLRGK
jgi:hypothetical protein